MKYYRATTQLVKAAFAFPGATPLPEIHAATWQPMRPPVYDAAMMLAFTVGSLESSRRQEGVMRPPTVPVSMAFTEGLYHKAVGTVQSHMDIHS